VGHSGSRCGTKARDGTTPQGNDANKRELVMGMTFVLIDITSNNGAPVGMWPVGVC
jgi:hypothetical protein